MLFYKNFSRGSNTISDNFHGNLLEVFYQQNNYSYKYSFQLCHEMFQMFSNVEVYESYRKYTNYYFSRQGITKLSQSQVFKGSEMLCASLSDPFEYSACLSMMKCKRFDPPYKGKYFFSFCPKVFFGGRLS